MNAIASHAVASATPGYAPAYHGGSRAPECPPKAVSVTVQANFAAIGNRREHWRARARRVHRELGAVTTALAGREPPSLPVTIELHRVGWNYTDADGLVGALKSPIDAVAEWLGVDDRDRRLHWRLSQSTTRAIRLVNRGHWRNVRETAGELRIVVRPWTPEDGEDALRVAPAPPPKRIRRKKGA